MRTGPILAAIPVFLLLSSCGAQEDVLPGVWAGRTGEDTFAFQSFPDNGEGSSGVIHCLRDGRKYSEVPMTDIRWSPPDIEVFTGATGFTYSGRLEDGVRSIVTEPGTRFRYVNADVNLLSGLLRRSTGFFPDRYAEEYLFGPLGIGSWDRDYGEDQGHGMMDGSLRPRPRDMLKIGMLVLECGEWNGARVLSEEWISESTEEHLPVDDLFGYGYLWWSTSVHSESGPLRGILAGGWGSQFILVVPDARTVVVTTGGNDDDGMNWQVLRLVQEVLFGGTRPA
ncbi:MAG: hypothetical protein AVO35_06335 [Candidatus Aegiribacteria sp. MLS_C]|nr:MAG: hypothetical protein AVO35_06335 [Candidatus Aegiribacteria sp. MLS_C]